MCTRKGLAQSIDPKLHFKSQLIQAGLTRCSLPTFSALSHRVEEKELGGYPRIEEKENQQVKVNTLLTTYTN